MARRYYLSKVVGTGTKADPYRPALLDAVKDDPTHVTGHVMPPGDADGKPTLPVCLVILSLADHSGLAGAADFDQWPAVSLDTTIASIPADIRNAVVSKITARGLTAPNLTGADTLRTLVRAVGKQVRADFDETTNDAPDGT